MFRQSRVCLNPGQVRVSLQAPGWDSPSYASMYNPAQTLPASDQWPQLPAGDTAHSYHPGPIYGLAAGVPPLAGQMGPSLGQVGDVKPHCHAATPLTKVHGTFRTSLRHHCTLKCCLLKAKGCCWWITMKSLIGCIQRLDGTLATFAISCGMRRLSCGAVQFFSCSILVVVIPYPLHSPSLYPLQGIPAVVPCLLTSKKEIQKAGCF